MAPKRQKILTDDEITEIIIKYIDEDIYNYAVMIDGEWGCGKTYFVKECLIKAIAEHEKMKGDEQRKKVVYISLYGVDSTNEISKQILLESYLEGTGKAKRLLHTGTKILGTAFSVLPALGIDANVNTLSDKLAELLPVKNSILIFDDLERCDCPINEILGYINTFVEQEGMKVIIVANEKEIGHATFQANQELRYLVAAHEGIRFEDDIEKKTQATNVPPQEKQQKTTEIDLNTLRKRINYLFVQNGDYERVKEKLIGNTIHYYPQLKKVFEKLINGDNISDGLKEVLQTKMAFFENHMINERHLNLRTFQFYLSKIQTIYEVIDGLNGEGKQAFLKYVVEYSFKICISYKGGLYKYKWSENEEYGFRKIGSLDIWEGTLAFRFIDDYIVGSSLDIGRAAQMLDFYEKEYIKKDSQELDSLRELELYWFLRADTDVESAVEAMLKTLDENEYAPNQYARIISILLRLEDAGFPDNNVSMAISKMKANIGKLAEHVYFSKALSIDSDATYKERYARIMDELQAEADRRFKEKTSNTLSLFLAEGDGWAGNLRDYIHKNFSEVSDQTGFLSKLDIDSIVAKLKVSKASDLYDFRGCILSLYSNPPVGAALMQDKTELLRLKEGIEGIDMDSLDRIKRMHIRYLIINLNQAIAMYDGEEAGSKEEVDQSKKE